MYLFSSSPVLQFNNKTREKVKQFLNSKRNLKRALEAKYSNNSKTISKKEVSKNYWSYIDLSARTT